MKKRHTEIKHYEHIEHLASALKECGYDVEIWWDAKWYCIDHKNHLGIELTINDVQDGEGNSYNFIFNRKGKKIRSCTEGELN